VLLCTDWSQFWPDAKSFLGEDAARLQQNQDSTDIYHLNWLQSAITWTV